MKRLWHLRRFWRLVGNILFGALIIYGIESAISAAYAQGSQEEQFVDFWKVLAVTGFGIIGTAILGLYGMVYKQNGTMKEITGRLNTICSQPGKECAKHRDFKKDFDQLENRFHEREREKRDA